MANRRRALLVPALMEGAGIFLLALLGADLMFGTELEGTGPGATLIPAVAFAVATVAYRVNGGGLDLETGGSDDEPAAPALVTRLVPRRLRPPGRSRRRAA